MARRSQKTSDPRRPARVPIETLEARLTPVTFGVPWADASHLSLSFIPDGTPIASHVSTLYQSLNQARPTLTWQRDIMRAFQTWAVNANINIGLQDDSGLYLGIPGQTQHDARFGDIRVGAQAMSSDALAVSIPNDPAVSGTLTGDVLINNQDTFTTGALDLYAVVLHEAGHVFGLPGSTDSKSVMFENYQGTTKLSAADINALQALYGVRAPDRNEGSNDNNALSRATKIQPINGDTGSIPLVAYGDVTTTSDVDFFAFTIPNGATGPVTIRLQSAGISLLAPKVSLVDAKGRVLSSAQGTSGFGDIVNLQLPSATPGATYYVKVEGATRDVFGIGGYGLAVSFDGRDTTPIDRLDAVLRGPYQNLSTNDLAALRPGSTSVLFHDDSHGNDEPGAATLLTSLPGYARNAHYETVGSLAGPTDSDFYKIKAADAPAKGLPLVLTVTTRLVSPNGSTPRVTILSSDGSPVDAPVQVLENNDGSFSIQAVGLRPSGNYLLRVGPDAAAGASISGNYSLTAHFSTTPARLDTLATDSLPTPGATRSYDLYVGRSQLMHMLLTADTLGAVAPAGSGVHMLVRDKSGRIVIDLTAAAGDTVSAPDTLLTPGAYTVEFTSVGTDGPALGVKLAGGVISDPIGPVLNDPTLKPDYIYPGLPGWFLYPGDIMSTNSYMMAPSYRA